MDFVDITFDHASLLALAQVVLIDITLAGDNAVVIGMTAARAAPEVRRRVIFYGLLAAVIMRVTLAYFSLEILQILGATLAGGLLLLWVSWRLYRDIREGKDQTDGVEAVSAEEVAAAHAEKHAGKYVSINRAVGLIALADLSMSLDNVLAVAGAAAQHLWVLIVGLGLSVALMGVAAVFIARLLKKYPWISYAGLVIVVFVAGRMIWEGGGEVFRDLHLW
jgi:YjbE family integral membrane protein